VRKLERVESTGAARVLPNVSILNHIERNHQGLKNALITPAKLPTDLKAKVERKQRFGGTLSYYFRDAA
jgi:hypothetical protein